MKISMTAFRFALAAASFSSALGLGAAPLNITVSAEQEGTTPVVLGYNFSQFMPGSNAPDWWRYTSPTGVRIFMAPSSADANSGNTEGITSLETFNARRAAVRANASDPAQPIDYTYNNLPYFEERYAKQHSSSSRFVVAQAFAELRKQGAEIFANLTASRGSFAITADDDWAGKWKLWQCYYTMAFYMARGFDVCRYSMYNEPNLAQDGAYTKEDWQMRLEITSDAMQAAIADVNARYGKKLNAKIFAPNLSGITGIDDWARYALENRHRRYDGATDPAWLNFHIYNYQRYNRGSESYATEITQFKNDVMNASVMGDEPLFPMVPSEFNTRTARLYDQLTTTPDHYSHFAALGGHFVLFTKIGTPEMYLFKFGQNEYEGINYPLAKNGLHYVNNDDITADNLNPYGGATQSAEAYRLFIKAARGARPYLKCTGDNYTVTSQNTQRYMIVTRDEANGFLYIYAASRNSENVEINFDLTALNIPANNVYIVDEISGRSNGGTVAGGLTPSNGILNITIPGEAVTLVTIPTKPQASMTGDSSRILEVNAVADAQLSDGALKSTSAGANNSLVVRSDGLTADGRHVTLIKVPVPAIAGNDLQVALLDIFAAATNGASWVHAHVYGLDDDNWDENTVTWASLTSGLKQNVVAGNKILNNVIANQGSKTFILSQLIVTSTTPVEKLVNVTDFVRRQTDGFASFLIVQDHRMEIALGTDTPAGPLTSGDTQPGGISIVSREGATGALKGPRLLVAATMAPSGPTLTAQPMSAQVDEGTPVTLSVGLENTAGVTYQWRKDGRVIDGATSSTLDIPGALADSGVYDVVVANSSGSIISQQAIVVITPAVAHHSPFVQPAGIAIDAAGNLYVSDYSRHTIRTIEPSNHISTLAGEADVAGSRNAVGTYAQFRNPTGLAVRDGKLYVADTGNAVIRSISTGSTVSPVGGNVGLHEHADGLGAAARFNYPEAVTSDNDGNIYVADTENHVIRKIAPGGAITTVAGMAGIAGALDDFGKSAKFSMPAGIAVVGGGTNLVIYVADTGNHTIRKISDGGYVTTHAGVPAQPGSSDGDALSARFREPRGMVVDADGTIYLADTGNSLIRAISGTTVTTLAGLPGSDSIPGLAGYKDGKGEEAWFSNPESLALGGDGKLYVADTGNRVIRVIDLDDNVTTLPATTRPQPPPVDEIYDSGSSGGGAHSFWMLGALAALALYRKLRR